MKKAYAAHEFSYRKMQSQGIRSWGQRSGVHGDPNRQIDANTERFLVDVLAQAWAPKGGQVIELGCGTGPILRWLNDRGFTGLGIDISETAVAMARDQSEGRRLRFRSADVCDPTLEGTESFDLVIDGHCLHCITTPLDRQALLRNAHRLLKPGGLFIVLTMCRPVNRVAFKRLFPGQFLRDGIIYVPSDGAGDYQGAHQIKGRQCLPTRYLGHWRAILTEIRRAEFTVQLFRYNGSTDDEPNGGLSVAALAK